MKKISPLLFIFAISPLFSGCLMSTILKERQETVVKAAKFDSNCSNMRVTDNQDDRRYKVEGCDQVYIYSCHDRRVWTGDGTMDTTQLLMAGNVDSDAPCHLVRHYSKKTTGRFTAEKLQAGASL